MAMIFTLRLNDIFLDFDPEEIGAIIVKVAQGLIDETELARYLRNMDS
ncbi:MAG: hypothetical protein RPU39_09235 [Candidatus Sedimenticola sp. (ex Thyasira tokunagai)]